MKSSPFKVTKQKLSKEAALKKKKRDIAAAKTPLRRKRKKAQNQRLDRAEGTIGDGLDRHHTGSSIKKVSIKNNRGNYGRGTKNE